MVQNKTDMLVHSGSDTKGPYFRWTPAGRKYYYIAASSTSRDQARARALRDAAAAYASRWTERIQISR
jgi:hypothetical protein